MSGVIALDVGEVRVGVARGERGSSFVFGRGFFRRGTQQEDVETVRRLLEQERATLVVIGLPTRHDGGDSKQTQRVRAFARALQAADIETVFEDERFTTRLAAQDMLSSGVSKKKRREKGRLDEAAAVRILESYLARQGP